MNTYTCSFCLALGLNCQCDPNEKFEIPEGAVWNGAPPWNLGIKGYSIHTNRSKLAISKRLKNIPKPESQKKKMSQAAVLRGKWKKNPESVRKTVATTIERRATGIINPYSQERNNKMAKSKTGTKRVYRSDGSFYYIRPQSDQ